MEDGQKKVIYRICISAGLLIVYFVLFRYFITLQGAASRAVQFAAYLVPYLIIGGEVLEEALEGIRNREPFDENFLMAVATVGAFLLGEYTEGCAVLIFYQLGELFEDTAADKSRDSITALLDIRPDYANLLHPDGTYEKISPDLVPVGSYIIVKPGERVPIDSAVTEGTSMVDMSALTGESVPAAVAPGDELISGSINKSGTLKARTAKAFGESTASRILELAENAAEKKSHTENFITRFARIYTPVVCFAALALAVIMPVISILTGGPSVGVWVYRALTFLVISCPCALVMSIPLTFFAGIGGAGTLGILIKGSAYLEALSKTCCILLDKTGTLTEGVFSVTGIYAAERGHELKGGISPDEHLLEAAACAESYSTHPIAESIKTAYGRVPDPAFIKNALEESGHGVRASLRDTEIAAGSRRFLEGMGIKCMDAEEDSTIVHVAEGGKYLGYITIADSIKPNSKKAIAELKKAGVRDIAMLTGDTEEIAGKVGAELGIEKVYAGLLPADKVARVEEAIASCGRNGSIVFAGDGINDAPVLARADVGIAMGALGSDAAIEAADVVLMDDDPLKLAKAIRISKKCMRIAYENIYFAIGIKLICLLLGAFGIANMWMAIFADVGVMVIAVLNAVRAMDVRNL